MDSLLIKGGVPLRGEVQISGAKNAVLPIMAATLLTGEPCSIRRVPNLSDVRFMGQILTWLGAQVQFEGDSVRVQAKNFSGRAAKVTYNEEKDQLIFDGGEDGNATLYRTTVAGKEPEKIVGKKITYIRKTGEYKVDDAQSFSGG